MQIVNTSGANYDIRRDLFCNTC